MTTADQKATLKELLTRFRDAGHQDDATVEQFAEVGAEALVFQVAGEPWITQEEAAAHLNKTIEEVRALVDHHQLAAARTTTNDLRFHRRDVSLYQLGQRLGATEEQVIPLTPPAAWEEARTWDLDPSRDLTPG